MKHIFDEPPTINLAVENTVMQWRQDLGIGFIPPGPIDQYDQAYWDKYGEYAKSSVAKPLNDARMRFVKRYFPGPAHHLCDVGIGNGDFVRGMGCMGTDVNPVAIKWLNDQGIYASSLRGFSALTFWDVLEHIEDPTPVLVAPLVFLSMPIHRDLPSCLTSKHLRPGEHVWHFTLEGIIRFMDYYNYSILEANTDETKAGRESISSFCFKRR